jgi:Ser/Thr protein kinase RdoA (MazF antagonist)
MSTEILSVVAQKLGIPKDKFQSLSGGHTSRVYGFERDGCDLVLRLIPPGEDMDVQAQGAVTAWVKYLSEHGAAVITPVPFDNGNLVEIIPSELGDWLAVLCEHAPGVLSETLPLEKWDAPLIQTFGQSVGKMHVLAKMYFPVAGMRRWSRPG